MILTINAWKPFSLENACKFHIHQRTSVGPAIQRSSVPAQFSVPAPRRPFSVAACQRTSARWGKQRTSVPAPGGESSVPAYQRRRLAGPLSHRTVLFHISFKLLPGQTKLNDQKAFPLACPYDYFLSPSTSRKVSTCIENTGSFSFSSFVKESSVLSFGNGQAGRVYADVFGRCSLRWPHFST